MSTPNLRLETVVSFLPDPRGWAMFGALTGRARRDLLARPVIDTRVDGGASSFTGWVASPQQFTGLAGLAAGRQRIIAGHTSQLVNERSNLNETAMRSFWDKLRREGG